MLVVGCSGGLHLAKAIATKCKAKYTSLEVAHFPDGELKLRLPKLDSHVVLVQSFYGNVSDKLIEVLFTANFARQKKAKRVTLVMPYAPYFRQDKEFSKGEIVSLYALGDLLSRSFDQVITIDPHLHREKNIHHVFTCKATRLTADELIAAYITKHVANPIIIGPDEESYQWAKHIADTIGCDYSILRKKRLSGTKVHVYFDEKIDLGKRTLILIDDIISTGHTLLETVKGLKANRVMAIAVHGLFMLNALEKLGKAGIQTITTNTIPNKVAKIDVSKLLADSLK